MANEQNLVPYKPGRSSEEAKKSGRLGGIASGEARRRKRDARKIMEGILKSIPVIDKATLRNLQTMGIQGVGKDHDRYDLELIAQAAIMQKAMRGDVKAYRLILETMGEDAATNRERSRMEHEERMLQLETMSPDLPDDGFLSALNSVSAFDNMPEDVPMDIDDGEDDDEDA